MQRTGHGVPFTVAEFVFIRRVDTDKAPELDLNSWIHAVELETVGGKWFVRVIESGVASIKLFDLATEANVYAEHEGQRLGVGLVRK